jgi:hypothetical protein
MLISTFSTSTLFTTIIAFLIYFIGHFQADARTAFLSQEAGMSDGILAKIITLLVRYMSPAPRRCSLSAVAKNWLILPLKAKLEIFRP